MEIGGVSCIMMMLAYLGPRIMWAQASGRVGRGRNCTRARYKATMPSELRPTMTDGRRWLFFLACHRMTDRLAGFSLRSGWHPSLHVYHSISSLVFKVTCSLSLVYSFVTLNGLLRCSLFFFLSGHICVSACSWLWLVAKCLLLFHSGLSLTSGRGSHSQ